MRRRRHRRPRRRRPGADTLKLSGHIEAGITGNGDGPKNGLNFGHLFTDRANTPLLNQLMLTAERPLI